MVVGWWCMLGGTCSLLLTVKPGVPFWVHSPWSRYLRYQIPDTNWTNLVVATLKAMRENIGLMRASDMIFQLFQIFQRNGSGNCAVQGLGVFPILPSFSKVNIPALATEGHLGEFVGLQPVRGLEMDSISNNTIALAVIYKYLRLTRKCMFFLPFLFIDYLGLR